MTHISRGIDEARTKDRNHNGRADTIRRLLEASAVPLTPDAISLRTGLRLEHVRRTIATMISCTGGVVSVRTGRGIAYQLYREAPAPRKVDGSARVASRITIGRGSRWGSF